MPKSTDLTGEIFTRLRVDYKLPTGYKMYRGRKIPKPAKYRCICECGNTKDVLGTNLTRGNIKSCGCLKDELVEKKKVDSIVRAKKRIGKIYGKLEVIGIMKKDGERIKFICLCECGEISYVMDISLDSGRTRSCGCSAIINLKRSEHKVSISATYKGTNINKIRRKTSTRTECGVPSIQKTLSGKWEAKIGFKGRLIHLGTHDDIKEAIRSRRSAEVMYHDRLIKEFDERVSSGELDPILGEVKN